jgi:signal transduction histidine kinase
MKASLRVLENLCNDPSRDLKNAFPTVTLTNHQVNKLAHILDDLLDVIKIQSGKIRLNQST